MFCNQCEQTAKGTGCTVVGICGKTETTAGIQDGLILALRDLAALRQFGACRFNPAGSGRTCPSLREVDEFLVAALFSTLTNVNFDDARLEGMLGRAVGLWQTFYGHVAGNLERAGESLESIPDSGRRLVGEYLAAAERPDQMAGDADVKSAKQILLYSLKGIAAYSVHALTLGRYERAVYEFVSKGLSAGHEAENGVGWEPEGLAGWVDLLLESGQANLLAMEALDGANTGKYGDPVPTPVTLGHREGKCILISGHDLHDLEGLLNATEGTGIQVYTHGEMLPAHAYPKLKAYGHLAGHYGTAWQNQHRELPQFPGPVLFTTNCIQNPKGYADKVFSSGCVGWPGVRHCAGGDYRELIAKAQEMEGYTERSADAVTVLTGFGRKTLIEAIPAVIERVAAGKIRHVFLVGGCDGIKASRDYYAEFVRQTPADTLVLTLACGKFRFFDEQLGDIDGLPRLLDVGQCNDAYAAIQLAVALADKLGCGVNELPLSLVLSWYEQKAVSILMTLLYLGITGVRIGPSLPAFISPGILDVLVDKWKLQPVTTPERDLEILLAGG